MQDPVLPIARVVAVETDGRTGANCVAGPWRLERGKLEFCIVIEGLPVGDLPAGARLRLGQAALVELQAASAMGAPGNARDGAPVSGLLEAGARRPMPAAVVEEGLVEIGASVALEAIVLPLTDVLDLHSFRPEDTRKVVMEYLDDARRAGLDEVRIVHGRGVGVQRAIVRGLLAEAPGVAGFSDAPPTRGGWGATIVRLRATEDAPSA